MNIPDYLHGVAQESLYQELKANDRRTRWAVVLGLKIQQDGDQFCILWGDNLQEGVAGFGSTPAEAIEAFEQAMNEPAVVPKTIHPKVAQAWNDGLATNPEQP